MKYRIILTILLFACLSLQLKGQSYQTDAMPQQADQMIVPAIIQANGDTLPTVSLRELLVFPELKFKNKKEQREYTKLVRDVKRTLPYAKLVYDTLIETYEYIETLPTDKERDAHLKKIEKDMFKQYKPELKKMTFSQGKLLIKLIDRECNQSSYNILNAFLGSFRANFWNFFAGIFGASLKVDYDPKGEDMMTERVVLMVERGMI